MKKYPRLYSLSTLGVRQHQEFDYKLHGFRTDFVGDSGCGKSMIADLVQLVFVGSEAFASGTDSMDKREVDGMVLRNATGRGTDMAYVLINIELKPNEYVAIGAYLETSSRQSRSFVIQNAWDETELSPVDRALTVSDITVDDQIPTLELLRESLEGQGLVFHVFPVRKKFHAYLHRHQLLSIDLSQSGQILRDYALIIQSFSRGKSLDISDGNSLKRFLFGNEKAKEITQKYRDAVEELQFTLKEHAQNAGEIEKVTHKYQALKVLRELRNSFDNDERDYLVKQAAYIDQQQREERESFRESGRDYLDAIYTLDAINEILERELGNSETTFERLSAQQQLAKTSYDESLSKRSRLLPFLALKEAYDCSQDQLIEIYRKYQKDKHRHKVISDILQVLLEMELKELLWEYIQLEGKEAILDAIQLDYAAKEAINAQKQQLLAFADLNNEGSLGNWAVQNYQAYSLEVESLLMFFKDLPVNAPNQTEDRFIPDPAQLLSNGAAFKSGNGGFWVDMGKISQFIPYVGEQLFLSEDIGELKELLVNMSNDLKGEIGELESSMSKLKSLRKFIVDSVEFSEFLQIHDLWGELVGFEHVPQLDMSNEEFETGVLLLKDTKIIQSEYERAEQDWKTSLRHLQDHERIISAFKKSSAQLDNLLSEDDRQQVLATLENVFEDIKYSRPAFEEQLEEFKIAFGNSSAKDVWVREIFGSSQQKLTQQDINREYEDYVAVMKNRKDIFQEVRLVLGREPDISAYAELKMEQPGKEQTKCEVSKRVYGDKFDEIVSLYASAEKHRFKVSQNYLELCTTVLPEAFLDETIEKETSIEVIGEYLSKINDKNKSLNNRKLLKIRDVLDEVADEISKREDTVRKIHNFLDNGDREITGGHRVSLRSSTQLYYPKSWINAYIEKLAQENTLFDTGKTLTELLSDSVSLEEKMIDAFHTFGGHRGTKPKVEDLLNPNSYFDLTFKMESHVSGKTNIGSTGQVYAAIALLCIARLSLVNKSSFNKNPPPGIRFMPIDEAEGLGSNFDLLYDIARDFDYQILTMGIKPLGRFKEGEQYIYMLSNNKEVPEDVNYQPFGVFCEADQRF